MGTNPELYHLPGLHEPFSAISHLFGALAFLMLGYILMRRGRRNPDGLVYLGIYAASVVLLLTLSALYHMVERGSSAHQIIGRLDHGAIFILIAGSFTPAHGILMHGWLRWGPLSVIWLAAVAGITLKTIFYDDLPEALILTFFLSMGWFGIVTGMVITFRYGVNFVKPLVLGGLAYTVGAVADFTQWTIVVPGVIHPHELMHVAVLVGAFWHWLFNMQFAHGDPAARETPA